jgi:hypothetical protein
MTNANEAKNLEQQTREFIEKYNLRHIELINGEYILEVTSDHFMEWLPRVLPLIGIAVLCMLASFLDASGLRLELGHILDPIIISLLVLFGFVATTKQISSSRNKPSQSQESKASTMFVELAIVVGSIVLLLLAGALYVYDGMIDGEGVATGLSMRTLFYDWINVIMIIVGLVYFGFAFYVYIESENDHLLLTTQRVIHSDREVLGKYQNDQIYVHDIQDVSSKTENYFQHWLKYGNIKVQSVRRTLEFRGAEYAQDMQAKIMAQMKAVRSERNMEDLHEVVDTKVYGRPAYRGLPKQGMILSESPAWLRYLAPDNPEIDEKGTITWRPHWIFLILTLIPPVVFLVVSFFVIIVASQLDFITGFWVAPLMILSLIVFLGWGAYRYEDHINDLYILSPTSITDIEKKPWGPEDRRNASLGALQNVTSKTTLVSRWLNYGDVFLETAGKGEFTFHKVPYPNEVVRTINNYQDEFRRGEKKRSLEDMGLMIKYYHDEQIKEHQHHATSASPENPPL